MTKIKDFGTRTLGHTSRLLGNAKRNYMSSMTESIRTLKSLELTGDRTEKQVQRSIIVGTILTSGLLVLVTKRYPVLGTLLTVPFVTSHLSKFILNPNPENEIDTENQPG